MTFLPIFFSPPIKNRIAQITRKIKKCFPVATYDFLVLIENLTFRSVHTYGYSLDNHSALHEAFDEIESIRNDTSESKFVPEYIVQIDINDSVPRPDKTRKFFFATFDETKETYFKYKNMAETLPQIYHVRLFEHVRKGQMMLLAEAGKPAPVADSTSKHGYKILITHKSGDIQTLHFDDIRAAKATFELMKYEIKANRIIYANLLYCIGDTKKQLDYANRMTVAKEA